jgi:hypothetical protein
MSNHKMGSYCCLFRSNSGEFNDHHDEPAAIALEALSPQTLRILESASIETNEQQPLTVPRDLPFSRVFPVGFNPMHLFQEVSSRVEEIVRDGFNATIVCYGRGSFKRDIALGRNVMEKDAKKKCIHGTIDIHSLEDALNAYGQIGGILFQLFEQV